MVRRTFFAPDEASTLSRANASASGVGHSVVGTGAVESGTGTSREVGVGTAELAAVVEVKVGTT